MKDCTTCKYGYKDERLGIQMCHHPKRFSEDCVDFNMHEEKKIKESEKPIDIDFEQELYKHFGLVKDFTLGMRIGQYFYELGKKDMKEQMMKEAIHYVVQDDLDSHGASYNIPFIRIGIAALKPKGIGVGDKVRIIIVKED